MSRMLLKINEERAKFNLAPISNMAIIIHDTILLMGENYMYLTDKEVDDQKNKIPKLLDALKEMETFGLAFHFYDKNDWIIDGIENPFHVNFAHGSDEPEKLSMCFDSDGNVEIVEGVKNDMKTLDKFSERNNSTKSGLAKGMDDESFRVQMALYYMVLTGRGVKMKGGNK